jgi:hypothetical protein
MTRAPSIISLVAVLILFASPSAVARNALHLPQKPARLPNRTVIGPHHPVTAMPLTKAECEGLGGTAKSVVTTVCASGQKCVTVDENNVIHAACIDKK